MNWNIILFEIIWHRQCIERRIRLTDIMKFSHILICGWSVSQVIFEEEKLCIFWSMLKCFSRPDKIVWWCIKAYFQFRDDETEIVKRQMQFIIWRTISKQSWSQTLLKEERQIEFGELFVEFERTWINGWYFQHCSHTAKPQHPPTYQTWPYSPFFLYKYFMSTWLN